MGTEDDFEQFIQLQKQKLAKERELLNYQQKENEPLNEMISQPRKQWSEPSPINTKQMAVQPSSNGLNVGGYEQKRKLLDDERKQEYKNLLATKAQGNTNRGRNVENGDTGLFSKLGEYETKRKVLDVERKNEYNNILTEAAARFKGGNREKSFNNPGLPGFRDHPSAEQSKMKLRNAEYNEFLHSQEARRQNRFADKKVNQGQTSNIPAGRKEYERTIESYSNMQTTPRGANSNDSYNQMLERKRQEESVYRRQNDPDVLPLREPPRQQAFQELDTQYNRKKVNFARDRSQDAPTDDVYDWNYSQERSKSFHRETHEPSRSQFDDLATRSRSVPPEEQGGLQFGGTVRQSAARRKKEVYRMELEEQMNRDKQARAREKRGGGNQFPGGYEPSANEFRGGKLPTPRQPVSYPEQNQSILDDRRPLASILNARRDLLDTSAPIGAPAYQPGLLERGFTGLYEPSILSQMQQPGVPPIDLYGKTSADQAYQYYGTRDPFISDQYGSYPPSDRLPPQQYVQQPQQVYHQQAQPQVSFNANTQPSNTQPKQSGPIGIVPQGLNFGDPSKAKNAKLTYQQELKLQMEEKERLKQAKKAEQAAYDQKLERDIQEYNPFGRGGGGAPMKDSSGKVVADLRSLNAQNTGRTPRTVTSTPAIPSGNTPRADYNVPAIDLASTGDAGPTGKARGGAGGLFGEPADNTQKTATDRYKEELKLQIEEKKRKADEEKKKLALEDEKEMKRLEDERVKLKSEYEAEVAKKKREEEETKRKNEEMKKIAEEKRLAAEQAQREQEERRKKENEEYRKLESTRKEAELDVKRTDQGEQRSSSPPIPTLRAKTQPPGSMELRSDSPPVPAQRAKTQDGSTARLQPERVEPPREQPVRSRALSARKSARPESRAKSAEVLNQLAAMRQQLQSERARVENALEKQKVDVYDPRTDPTRSDLDMDVFEIARNKKPVTAGRRQKPEYEPSISEHDQKHGKPGTATSLLQSDSAFIDNNGIRAGFPDDFEALATNQNARRKRRERLRPAQAEKNDEFSLLMKQYLAPPDSPESMLNYYQHQNAAHDAQRKVYFKDEKTHSPKPQSMQSRAESVVSIDPDRITRKNHDRLRKLKSIAGDDISLADPDDIIDRFMNKQSHNRPASGQTLNDDSWINAAS